MESSNDNDDHNLTVQLRRAAAGDQQAQDRVFRQLQPEIKNIARGLLRRESNAQSMQTTMLADDAFLKFVGDPRGLSIADQRHFFRLIANYVTQLLIDAARVRNAGKRGAGRPAATLQDADLARAGSDDEFLCLAEALERLERTKQPAAEVFKMRELLRFDNERVAAVLEVSPEEVEALYRFAAAWLKRELSNGD